MWAPSQCNFKKGTWTPSEDALLQAFVKEYGAWSTAHSYFESRLQRCSSSCRLRYLNQLRKGLGFRRRDTFPPAQERIIFMLAGRTYNDVKNFWNIRSQSQRLQRQAAFLLAPTDSGFDEPAFSNGCNISPSQVHLPIINSRRPEAPSRPFTRTMAKTVAAFSSTSSYSAALHQLTTSILRYHSGDVVVSATAGVQLPSVQLFPTSANHDGWFAATGGHKGHPPVEAVAPSKDDIPHDGFYNQEHGYYSSSS